MVKLLTDEEMKLKKMTLPQLKEIVIEGIEAAGRSGFALIRINDEKLYLEDGYKSFKEFCNKEFEHSRVWAYQLMNGARALKSLPQPERKMVKNATAAAALAKVKLPERKKVVQAAAKDKPDGKADAKSIKREAAKLPERKRVVLHDKFNIEIPPEIEQLWVRGRNDINELVDNVSQLIGVYEEYEKTSDPLFAEIGKGMGNLIAKLKAVRQETELAIPYTVCPTCNGVLDTDQCPICKGRGFISKWYFDNHVPDDHIRKIQARKG